jgi:hypothetical protein
VLRGWGGRHLLDSYEYERRPASSRATEVSLLNYSRLSEGSRDPDIEAASEAGDAARRRVGERLMRQNERSWKTIGVHLGYIYHPSPIVVPDGTPRPADDTHGYLPSTFPGARAPHVWLRTDLSTLDLFGEAFVLLKFDEVDTRAMEEAAALRGVPLRVHYLASPEAAKLYEKRFVLVRPDGHVAWRGDELPQSCLAVIDTVRGAGPLIGGARGDTRTAEPSRPTLVPAPQQARAA